MSHRPNFRILNPTTVLATIIAMGLTGCSQSIKTTPTSLSAVIDGTQTQNSARVAMGETLTVALPTKVGALYAWRLTPESAATNNVSVLDYRQQMNAHGDLAFGDDPASDMFVFNANKPGVTTLEFVYDCPPGCPQSMTSHVTVNVEVFDAKAEAIAKAKAQQEAELAAAAAAKKAEEIAAAQAESQKIAEPTSEESTPSVASVDDSSN